jgi:tripartite-type tricarboxylate transporter receptor subunit TctC
MTQPWLRRGAAVLAILMAGISAAAPARAAEEAWPTKAIRFIVPFPPGGPNDVLARLVGDFLNKALGQPLVIENRPAASGNLAADLVAKAPADGYTIMIASSGVLGLNRLLFKELTYDPAADFIPVTMLAHAPMVLEVRKDMPVQTFREFVALIRANPGKYNFGHPGAGTAPHLLAEWVRSSLDLKMEPIPYRGRAAIMDALNKDEIQITVDQLFSAIPLHRGGKARSLAITSRERWPLFAEIPTLAEEGVPDVNGFSWFSLAVRTGTPRPVVDRLSAEVRQALHSADAKERLDRLGFVAIPGTPEEARKYVDVSIAEWSDVIRRNNIRNE